MIKSYVITITEVDDTEFALEELETQLSKIELMKNTIGIVSVSTDYFETGVYAAVAKALPFPLIGMSAYAQNANGNIGIYLFSILVLTSDDCEFAHGISDEIPEQGDVTALTRELYKKTVCAMYLHFILKKQKNRPLAFLIKYPPWSLFLN